MKDVKRLSDYLNNLYELHARIACDVCVAQAHGDLNLYNSLYSELVMLNGRIENTKMDLKEALNKLGGNDNE